MQFKTSLLITDKYFAPKDEPWARLVLERQALASEYIEMQCDLDPRAQKIALETLWRDEVADGFVNS
jgi:hypothetical protein